MVRASERPERQPMKLLVPQFLEDLRVKGRSERTAETYAYRLQGFLDFCADREHSFAHDVTRGVLERFQRHLFHRTSTTGPTKGERLSVRSQQLYLSAVRSFFSYLVKNGHIDANPAADLELPAAAERLPRNVLTVLEAEAILSRPDLSTPLGVRDRALLELLFATGIRRAEAAALELYDLDQTRRTLRIRKGKGGRERVVPTGERALFYLEDYLRRARPALASSPAVPAMFVTQTGRAISQSRLGQRVADYVLEAELGKTGSCHLFRHSMATLMLEGGADIRYIQAMLGHAQLGTTEIYTHVSVDALKEVHSRTHPAARLQRRQVERAAASPTPQE